MESPRAGAILLAVVAAGLLAGLAVGFFHYVATEPVIERAIVIETMAHPGEADEAPLVSRDVQRTGLIVGWALYGLFVGLIFGVAYALARPRFDSLGTALNVFLSALVAYWLVGLFPFLKYPANPPGIGDPETIAYRQTLFLLFWVLSVGGLLAAGWIYRLLRPRLAGATSLLVTLAAYAVYACVLYLAMPPNPDPVEMPGDLVTAFRVLSVVGLTLFWVVLGAVCGLLIRRLERSPRRRLA